MSRTLIQLVAFTQKMHINRCLLTNSKHNTLCKQRRSRVSRKPAVHARAAQLCAKVNSLPVVSQSRNINLHTESLTKFLQPLLLLQILSSVEPIFVGNSSLRTQCKVACYTDVAVPSMTCRASLSFCHAFSSCILCCSNWNVGLFIHFTLHV